MNKTQTKIEAGRYEAPQMGEHTLTLRRRILDGSTLEGTSIDDMDNVNVNWD